jgi:hypothetical protein
MKSDLGISASIAGTVSLSEAKKAADVLRHAGWTVRKAGFAEFEVRAEDFEIYIESASPVLVHGPAIEPLSIATRLAKAFRSAGIRCSFELYDSNRNLVSVVTDEKRA